MSLERFRKRSKRFFGFAFLAGYLGSLIFRSVSREAASRTSHLSNQTATTRGPDAALRKKIRVTQSGKGVNGGRVTDSAQKRHFRFIHNNIRSSQNTAEDPPS